MHYGKRAALAAALAVAVGLGGWMLEPATASAGLLGGIGSAVGLGGDTKVSIEDLTARQNKLLTNLARSTALMAIATDEMNGAFDLGIQTQGFQGAKVAANAAMQGGSGAVLQYGEGTFKGAGLDDKKAVDNVGKRGIANAQAMLSENNEAKLKQVDGAVSRAKTARLASDGFVAAAAVDATKILKDASSGAKGGGELVSQYEQITKTVKAAQAVLKMRSQVSGMLKNVSKAYEKTRPAPEPTEDELKASEAGMDELKG